MTLRKFLRFFKHFRRYMAYDIRWLKNKIRQRKDNKMQMKLKKHNEAEIEKFRKILEKIHKNAVDWLGFRKKEMITCGNSIIYIPLNPQDKIRYSKIFVKDKYVNVVYKNKTYKFRREAFTDITWKNIIDEYFYIGNSHYRSYEIAILFKEMSNKTIVRVGKNCVLLYQTCGKQPKRLMYTMKWSQYEDGYYNVSLLKSRKHAEIKFVTHVNPEEFLK